MSINSRIRKINKTVEQTVKRYGKDSEGLMTKITLTRPDNKFLIDPKDVRQMVDELHNRVQKQSNDFAMYIRVWNIDRVYTFTVNDDGDILGYDNHEDYFKGTIRRGAINKFLKHGKVEIVVERF